ncbi:GNAT family N-acetyltransferase [Amedibacillus sp. YH-ame6]
MRLDMPVVETSRLLLRPVEEGDACDLYEVYKSPEVTKYLSFPCHEDVDVTLQLIKTRYLPYQRMCIPQAWVMVWKEQEKVIGTLRVHTIEDDIGEIGYALHPAYWHKGIMKEALKELVNVAFEHIGVRRLEAKYEVDNMGSEHVLKACGFQKEGILRQYAKLSDKQYHDMVLAAILKDDLKGE